MTEVESKHSVSSRPEDMRGFYFSDEVRTASRAMFNQLLKRDDLLVRSSEITSLEVDQAVIPASKLRIDCYHPLDKEALESLLRECVLLSRNSIVAVPRFVPPAFPTKLMSTIEAKVSEFPELDIVAIEEAKGTLKISISRCNDSSCATEQNDAAVSRVSQTLGSVISGFNLEVFEVPAIKLSVILPNIKITEIPFEQHPLLPGSAVSEGALALEVATKYLGPDLKPELDSRTSKEIVRAIHGLIVKHGIWGGKITRPAGSLDVQIEDESKVTPTVWEFLHDISKLEQARLISVTWRIGTDSIFRVLSEELGHAVLWDFKLDEAQRMLRIACASADTEIADRLSRRLGIGVEVDTPPNLDGGVVLFPKGVGDPGLREAFRQQRMIASAIPEFLLCAEVSLRGNQIVCDLGFSTAPPEFLRYVIDRLPPSSLPIVFRSSDDPRTPLQPRNILDGIEHICSLFPITVKDIQVESTQAILTISNPRDDRQQPWYGPWLDACRNFSKLGNLDFKLRWVFDRQRLIEMTESVLRDHTFDIKLIQSPRALVITVESAAEIDQKDVEARLGQALGIPVLFQRVAHLPGYLHQKSLAYVRKSEELTQVSPQEGKELIGNVMNLLPAELRPANMTHHRGLVCIGIEFEHLPENYLEKLKTRFIRLPFDISIRHHPTGNTPEAQRYFPIIQNSTPEGVVVRDILLDSGSTRIVVHNPSAISLDDWQSQLQKCLKQNIEILRSDFSAEAALTLSQLAPEYRRELALASNDAGEIAVNDKLRLRIDALQKPTHIPWRHFRLGQDRLDLSSWSTLTLDRNTQVFTEDAISFSPTAEGGLQFAVNFSDLTQAFKFNSAGERILRERVCSFYNGSGGVRSEDDHFIPDHTLKRYLYFQRGRSSAALSFIAEIDKEGRLLGEPRAERTIVSVDHKFSFRDFLELKESHPAFGQLVRDLARTSEAIKSRDIRMGRFNFSDPTDENRIISPFLEFAKATAGRLIAESGATSIFRAQRAPTPEEIQEIAARIKAALKIESTPEDIASPLAFRNFLARIPREKFERPLRQFILDCMGATYDTTDPTQLHFGMGSNYVELAALRDYRGLMAQLQISAILQGDQPIPREEVTRIATELNWAEKVRRIRIQSREFVDSQISSGRISLTDNSR